MNERARVAGAAVVASVAAGTPSTAIALATTRSISATIDRALDATRAVGTLVPPGRPSLLRGAIAHVAIAVGMGAVLRRVLPEEAAIAWGAGAGLVMGVVNVGIIGRRFPAIRSLPLVPQLADNLAFGVVFAALMRRHPGADERMSGTDGECPLRSLSGRTAPDRRRT